jgi:L,D-transpeptidase ErfK/SrfK
MHDYFNAIDSLCRFIDSSYGVSLNEYEFIRANPVILDSLRSQDYYEAKERGVLILNQQDCLVIHSGQQLSVPDSNQLLRIRLFLKQIRLDVNVPEYTLRIWCGDSLIHRCIVRVGRNERKFLALAGREVDLKTPIGKGRIVRIERDPLYINPVNGERYYRTRRDDGRYTMLPRIPFLEPEINGIRSGALLHPTTNKSTLGKAISNGCIGMSEADAWTLYYHAPLGTPIEFRYDLNVIDENGNSKKLDNIYNR